MERMIMNWKGCGRKLPWSDLRPYPGIFLEAPRKTTESLRIAGHRAEILNPEFP
jgi:hypothetical protein